MEAEDSRILITDGVNVHGCDLWAVLGEPDSAATNFPFCEAIKRQSLK